MALYYIGDTEKDGILAVYSVIADFSTYWAHAVWKGNVACTGDLVSKSPENGYLPPVMIPLRYPYYETPA